MEFTVENFQIFLEFVNMKFQILILAGKFYNFDFEKTDLKIGDVRVRF